MRDLGEPGREPLPENNPGEEEDDHDSRKRRLRMAYAFLINSLVVSTYFVARIWWRW